MKPSLGYRIVERIARLLGHKRIYSLGAVEMAAYLEKAAPRRRITPPAFIKARFALRTETIHGRPCYIIAPKAGPRPGRALFFLHGGGFITEAHAIHWRTISILIRRLGCEVWFPVYPLLPGAQIPEAARMIYACYQKLLETRKAGEIVLLGDSAGAALGIILCHLNRDEAAPLPMPSKLILVCPAMLAEHDPAVLEAMRRIEERGCDVLLSLTTLDSLGSLCGLDPSGYFAAPFYGNLKGFPEMHIFTGTREVCYPEVPPFVERLRRAGVKAELYTGEEMMHVWPYMPMAKESAAALERITGLAEKAWA